MDNLELFSDRETDEASIRKGIQVCNESIDRRLAQIKLERAYIETLVKGLTIQCDKGMYRGTRGCGEYHPIPTVPLIQTHWYVSPRGCSEGDYWNTGPIHYVCPTCGHRSELKQDNEFYNYKHLFAGITDEDKD